MAITLRHATTATQPNRGDGEIGKDEWNENHSLGMGGDAILGRASASDGPVQEIACTAAGRALLDDADAAAQRVTLGLNTTANQTFTASGSGAVARSVQSKIAEIVSVKDFGAVGDGVTNDAAAFQAALATADVVLAPLGTYKIDTGITFAYPGKHLILFGSLVGSGNISGVNVVRHANRGFAVGSNYNNLGTGLQIGGGNDKDGAEGVMLATDGYLAWLRFQPSKDLTPLEAVFYPTGAQGIAEAVSGTGTINRISGTAFSEDWIGRKFYIGEEYYRVSSVSDADTLTVEQYAGGAVSFASTYNETFHVFWNSGTGLCQVSGTTVTRFSGDPFTPFYLVESYKFTLNGTEYTVTGYTGQNEQQIASPPAAGIYTYVFDFDINDQLTTLRLQKLIGSNEENLSVYARYDGYHIRTLFAGDGKYRKLHIGSGELSGAVNNQIVAQPNGDLTIGGDYGQDSLRVLTRTGDVANRIVVNPAATGFYPSFAARGTDTTVGLAFDTQANGPFTFTSNEFGVIALQVLGATGTDTYLEIATGSANVFLNAKSSGSNADLSLVPKGTGLVRFGAFTSGSDAAITGHITIKDASGNTRKLAVIA